MIIRSQTGLVLFLIALGIGWGLTQPLIKIAVTGGYEPLAIIFYQFLAGTFFLGGFLWLRGRRLPFGKVSLAVWLMIAFVGTIVPNYAGFEALKTLPAGIYSLLIATIPMMAFPIALLLGNEGFAWRRLIGLLVGLIAVGLIVFPEASLPNRAMIAVIPLALVAPLCYAFEGNLVAKFGLGKLDAIQAMFGASAVGAILTFPVAQSAGMLALPDLPFNRAETALILTAIIHTVVYCGYVWLVGRAGPIFAAQISYIVTGSGVVWAMVLLGERFSSWIWLALAVMALGVALVQPRPALAPEQQSNDSKTAPRT